MPVYQLPTDAGTCAGRRDRSSRRGRLRGLLAAWAAGVGRRREMAEVMAMPEHLLRDIGIAREDAYREYRKPFWRC